VFENTPITEIMETGSDSHGSPNYVLANRTDEIIVFNELDIVVRVLRLVNG
jgi:hypothetical protein